MDSLFSDEERERRWREPLAEGAWVLRQFALRDDASLVETLRELIAAAPFRRMQTPGGRRMSVALSSCGSAGWVCDAAGYRYTTEDPRTGLPWPPMPAMLRGLAAAAAAEAGYAAFAPDACLINLYLPGSRMGLHQDRDEADLTAPIVSVSLGLPALFQFGGLARKDAVKRIELRHGDVVVWGGVSRLCFHGVVPLKPGAHGLLGERRINLTFRKAL